MKAIFVHRDTLLRDSNLTSQPDPEQWRLVPATLEAVRNLAGTDTLLFLYSGCSAAGGDVSAQGLGVLARQVEAAGGRVDGLISCPHVGGGGCRCWGPDARGLWGTSRQFGLRLNECYVVGDTGTDVTMAYAVGARPIMVLNGRTLGEVLGRLPEHKGFPVATDLSMAAGYVSVEEDISRQLGHQRLPAAPQQPEDLFFGPAEDLPTVTVVSPMARNLQVQLNRSRAQLSDVGRWLSFFVLGALGLSLGIAYMMTHLYRVQPFPEFVYYLTLQFISRPLRGALFIVLGLLIIVVAARSFFRSSSFRLPRKRSE